MLSKTKLLPNAILNPHHRYHKNSDEDFILILAMPIIMYHKNNFCKQKIEKFVRVLCSSASHFAL